LHAPFAEMVPVEVLHVTSLNVETLRDVTRKAIELLLPEEVHTPSGMYSVCCSVEHPPSVNILMLAGGVIADDASAPFEAQVYDAPALQVAAVDGSRRPSVSVEHEESEYVQN
jgi:hypothetical protein